MARRIVDFMDERIAGLENPRSTGKALTGPLGGFWRYRVGDYRVICDIQDGALRVLVVQGWQPARDLPIGGFMDAQQQIFGLMAVAEEHQKAVKAAIAGLAAERAALHRCGGGGTKPGKRALALSMRDGTSKSPSRLRSQRNS